jgi:hypothetical protein
VVAVAVAVELEVEVMVEELAVVDHMVAVVAQARVKDTTF